MQSSPPALSPSHGSTKDCGKQVAAAPPSPLRSRAFLARFSVQEVTTHSVSSGVSLAFGERGGQTASNHAVVGGAVSAKASRMSALLLVRSPPRRPPFALLFLRRVRPLGLPDLVHLPNEARRNEADRSSD